MAKFLILFLLVAGFSLFYPFRDLYVREDAFSDEYTLVSEGFWTRDACVDAASAQRAEDFYCRKRTMFEGFLGVSARYNSAGLEQVD